MELLKLKFSFSPTRSSSHFYLESPSHHASSNRGAISKTSPKKSPEKMDKSKRQVLDKNIKQLFGARMTSKGITNFLRVEIILEIFVSVLCIY